ncbi:MAG: DNA polymerase III subunit delta [Sphingopyxis sp.]
MILKAHEASRTLIRLNPDIRLYLFGGPDEAGSRALRDIVASSLGEKAERIDLSTSRIKEDPALIADEAAAIGLFGGARWVSVSVNSGSGDELLVAVENLLNAPAAGNPVIVTVIGLTTKSRLTKVAERDNRCIAAISYPPEARDAEQIISTLALALGLEIDRKTGSAIAAATVRDRGLMAREIEKLALYCDSSPDTRTRASIADWEAIGAGVDGADMGPLINATFGGQLAELPQSLAELESGGALDIALVRSLLTRAHLLARLRVAVEEGERPAQVVAAQGKAIFWKEKTAIERQLSHWDAARLARVALRLHQLENALKAPGSPGGLLVRQAVMEIARAAAR